MTKTVRVVGLALLVLVVVSMFGAGEITKDTPIPPKTAASPVIVSQTWIGLPKYLSKKYFYGLKRTSFALTTKEVYRSRYYMHRTELLIPDERAVRLSWVKQELTDGKGMDCLMAADEYIVNSPSIEGNISSINTTLEINWVKVNEQLDATNYSVVRFNKDQKDSLGKPIKVTSIIKYNVTLKPNKTCTQVMSQMVGTIIRLYETNPAASYARKNANTNSLLTIEVLGILCLVFLIL